MNRKIAKLLVLVSMCGVSISIYAQKIPSLKTFASNPDNVKLMDLGFQNMRYLSTRDPKSAEFRTSLLYWANIHGYYSEEKNNVDNVKATYLNDCLADATTTDEKKICDTYASYFDAVKNQFPPDFIAQLVWGQCPHTYTEEINGKKVKHISETFLPWHRLYIHYFEKTLKKASGNTNFQLPYWKYDDNLDARGVSLPVEFKQKNLSTFDHLRTIGLNEGTNFVLANQISAKSAFELPNFLDFSVALEQGLHGNIHCAFGTNCAAPHLGKVPAAGNDPIFYLHHRNIDRIWQAWMVNKAIKNGTRELQQKDFLAWAKANLGMNAQWFDNVFAFIDPNGQTVKVTVADAFKTEFLPDYEDLNVYVGDPKLLTLQSNIEKSPLGAHNTTEVKDIQVLGKGKQGISLPIQQLTSGLSKNQEAASYLYLKDIEIVGNPQLTYSVYLVNKQDPNKSSYLTTLSFFGLNDHGGEHAHHVKNILSDVKLLVSDDLAAIQAKRLDDVTITFEATDLTTKPIFTPNNASGIKVGSISLVSEPIVK